MARHTTLAEEIKGYIDLGTLVSLFVGPVLLGWGLRKLKEKRLIENTPTSKVRSAAVGIVELSGTAQQRKPMKAPVSETEACWWYCRVEELRMVGVGLRKRQKWVTIKRIGSVDFFYVDDSTGRMLINPEGAEFHVGLNTVEITGGTSMRFTPILNTWDILPTTWSGVRMRIKEQVIPHQAQVFVLGELTSTVKHLEDRHAQFIARLRAIKADASKMAEADADHDGTIDAAEWDAFRHKQEEDFLKEEMARQDQIPEEDKMVVQRPAKGDFVVSTETEGEVLTSLRSMVPKLIFGGIALTGLAVWFASRQDWGSPVVILSAVGLGLVAGFFISRS